MNKNLLYLFCFFALSLLSGCASRCDIDQLQYATFSNTFSTDVSIAFRYRVDPGGPFSVFREIIPANETRSILVATIEQSTRDAQLFEVKVHCKKDSYETNNAGVQLSNSSLSQYTFCQSSILGNGIDILPINSICDNQTDPISNGY